MYHETSFASQTQSGHYGVRFVASVLGLRIGACDSALRFRVCEVVVFCVLNFSSTHYQLQMG